MAWTLAAPQLHSRLTGTRWKSAACVSEVGNGRCVQRHSWQFAWHPMIEARNFVDFAWPEPCFVPQISTESASQLMTLGPT